MALTHWFKKKEIVLDAFTFDNRIFETSQIRSAAFSKPDWWKNIKPESNGKDDPPALTSFKFCNGFNALYSNSLCVHTPFDFKILINNEGVSAMSPAFEEIGACHDVEAQMQSNPFGQDTAHFKLSIPWFLQSSQKLNCSMTSAIAWDAPAAAFNVNIVQGVIDYQNGHELNVNMVFKRIKEEIIYGFDALKPLAFLTPLTDKKVQVKSHLVTLNEFEKIKSKPRSLFFHKRLSKENKLKCPFHK